MSTGPPSSLVKISESGEAAPVQPLGLAFRKAGLSGALSLGPGSQALGPRVKPACFPLTAPVRQGNSSASSTGWFWEWDQRASTVPGALDVFNNVV